MIAHIDILDVPNSGIFLKKPENWDFWHFWRFTSWCYRFFFAPRMAYWNVRAAYTLPELRN
jgi:hypothetical protein